MKKIAKTIGSFWPWKKSGDGETQPQSAVVIDDKVYEANQQEKLENLIKTVARLAPELRKIMRDDPTAISVETDGSIIGRMYDFYANLRNRINDTSGFMTAEPTGGGVSFTMDQQGRLLPPTDKRIRASPKSVSTELQTVPLPFTMEKLDEKIEMMEKKSVLATMRFTKDQIDGMKKRLQNRKRYNAGSHFYELFPNTTDELIENLTAKYQLTLGDAEAFVPDFPQDATDVMAKYTDITKSLTGETPVFYVIAEEIDFKRRNQRRDPILLVQSPFGFYWQILGAWDKEMLLLSEL